MNARIAMITLDCLDPISLANWWADRLDGNIVQENEGWFVIVAIDGSPSIAFQKVPDPTPGKNRIHLDLTVDDLSAATELYIAAGASLVGQRSMDDFKWVTLADPEGNQFCIANGH